MGFSSGDIPGGVSKDNITLQAMQQVAAEEQVELSAEQEDSKAAFLNQQSEAVNPFAARAQTTRKDIKTNLSRTEQMLKAGKSSRLLPIEFIKESAEKFQGRNPELKAGVLVLLRQQISEDDSTEEILQKLHDFYPDPSLADEALEFLIETSTGKLAEKLKTVRQEFQEAHKREIAAGRNIAAQAREASDKGLGTATSLRDMYRDITGNPRDSTTMFEELSKKYDFKELKQVVSFLLHSLGADMKSKGPSIPRGLLHRLISETRNLQAIMGVYRFFSGRMGLMKSMFERDNLEMPSQLTFENLAKCFMQLCSERYPSSDKVLQQATKLGIDKWIQAKIIAFTQLRDAIREVAMNQIYRSLQHRDELYMALIEALENLEDELEELLGKEEDEDEEEDEKDDDAEDIKK